ncbi:hypothetical protein V6Z11_D07G113200 [Gossypium hirsutum]
MEEGLELVFHILASSKGCYKSVTHEEGLAPSIRPKLIPS